MRRFILFFFLFVLVGIALSIIFHDQHGYLLLAYGSWRIETSMLFAAAVLVFGLWLIFVLWRLLVAGVLLPNTLRGWRQRRQARKARQSLDAGLLYLLECRWKKAETELVRLAENNTAPQVNYLAAARSAQMVGSLYRRDRHLEKASAGTGSSELATLMTQAQLQYEARQDGEALASLTRLREIDPGHPRVLGLLISLCARIKDWPRLREILPDARKAGVLDDQRWHTLAVAAWCAALEQAETADQLAEIWQQVPGDLSRDSDINRVYTQRLGAVGSPKRAADQIRSVLNKQWDPALVLLFAQLEIDDRTAQLTTLEKWRKRYGDKPELSLAAGRLCMRNRLWGRAHRYFEQSLKGEMRPDALLELGRLIEETDEQGDACSLYRQGLEVAIGKRSD